MQSGSEKELQSQLNESGVARRLRKSPCTIGIAIVHRAATYAGIKICAVVGRRTVEEKLARNKLGIVMVPHIEKLCAELEAISLADRKGLEYREVPVLETRPADDVPARISERAEFLVGGKSTSVKQCSGNARLRVRIANAIRT